MKLNIGGYMTKELYVTNTVIKCRCGLDSVLASYIVMLNNYYMKMFGYGIKIGYESIRLKDATSVMGLVTQSIPYDEFMYVGAQVDEDTMHKIINTIDELIKMRSYSSEDVLNPIGAPNHLVELYNKINI